MKHTTISVVVLTLFVFMTAMSQTITTTATAPPIINRGHLVQPIPFFPLQSGEKILGMWQTTYGTVVLVYHGNKTSLHLIGQSTSLSSDSDPTFGGSKWYTYSPSTDIGNVQGWNVGNYSASAVAMCPGSINPCGTWAAIPATSSMTSALIIGQSVKMLYFNNTKTTGTITGNISPLVSSQNGTEQFATMRFNWTQNGKVAEGEGLFKKNTDQSKDYDWELVTVPGSFNSLYTMFGSLWANQRFVVFGEISSSAKPEIMVFDRIKKTKTATGIKAGGLLPNGETLYDWTLTPDLSGDDLYLTYRVVGANHPMARFGVFDPATATITNLFRIEDQPEQAFSYAANFKPSAGSALYTLVSQGATVADTVGYWNGADFSVVLKNGDVLNGKQIQYVKGSGGNVSDPVAYSEGAGTIVTFKQDGSLDQAYTLIDPLLKLASHEVGSDYVTITGFNMNPAGRTITFVTDTGKIVFFRNISPYSVELLASQLVGAKWVVLVIEGAVYSNKLLLPYITGMDPTPSVSAIFPATGVVNPRGIAAGSWITVLGKDFCSKTESASGDWPLTLAGVQALVDGQTIPLQYVGLSGDGKACQVNAQLPWEVLPGDHTVTIRTTKESQTFSFKSVDIAPSLFVAPPDHPSIFQIASQGSVLMDEAHPAYPGDTLVWYGDGFGPISPAVATGKIRLAASLSAVTSAVQAFVKACVTVDGKPDMTNCDYESANTDYVVAFPGSPAGYQGSITLPEMAVDAAKKYYLVIRVNDQYAPDQPLVVTTKP